MGDKINNLSNYFHRRAKGKLILFIFISLVLFIGITLPLMYTFYPDSKQMVSLDSTISSPQQTFSIIESWGDSGRNFQFWLHLTWDIIVPLLTFFFFALFISWLFQRGFKSRSKLQKINLIAFASIFDILENVCINLLIIFYPSQSVIIAWMKNIFTASKYVFGVLIILIILIGLIKAVKNKFEIQK